MTEIKTEIICEDVTQKSIVKNKLIPKDNKNNEYDLNMSLKALDTNKNKTSLNKDSYASVNSACFDDDMSKSITTPSQRFSHRDSERSSSRLQNNNSSVNHTGN